MERAVTFQENCQHLLDDYVACYRVGDAVGCAAVYAPEAELYSPYGPAATGRAAIKAAHQDWVAEGAEDKQIKVINADCSGDLGWCLAHYSEGATGMGTSMNILARQSNGDWLITHCSLNEACRARVLMSQADHKNTRSTNQ